ncbi:DUF11 domain-containing protein [Methylomagnum ishizawai]|uniref:DUF11 domain-containing protein n=1 Tax=Methylomagnum ishizawai TaxID=1760988 RepID=UPI001C7FF901|nr:DUF11 domain-containing protein [Methylomagnum ishizawai]
MLLRSITMMITLAGLWMAPIDAVWAMAAYTNITTDLSVAGRTDYDPALFQDTLGYTVTLSNHSSTAAQGTVLHIEWIGLLREVSSDLPAECTHRALASLPGYDWIECPLGDLAAGETRVYHMDFDQLYRGATSYIRATVSSDQVDTDTSNNDSRVETPDLYLLPGTALDASTPAGSANRTQDANDLAFAMKIGAFPKAPRAGRPVRIVARFVNPRQSQTGIMGVLYTFSKQVDFLSGADALYQCRPVEPGISMACLFNDVVQAVHDGAFPEDVGVALERRRKLKQMFTVVPKRKGPLSIQARVFGVKQDPNPDNNTRIGFVKVRSNP